jgi:glutaredoxin 3
VLKITVYTTDYCGYCVRAKTLLQRNGLAFEEVDASDRRAWLAQASGRRTVPQIWIGDHHVGGYQELRALESAGELLPLARGEAARPLSS